MSGRTLPAIAVLLMLLLLLNELGVIRGQQASNPPKNPFELVVDSYHSIDVSTLDPAESGGGNDANVISNTYETLLFFDGERCEFFIPQLAEQVWFACPDPSAPPYTNYTVYFKIHVGVPFHMWSRTDDPFNWSQYYLSTADVEYSLERCMVHDYGSSEWLLFEALLDCYGADVSNPAFGQEIDDAVQCNSTHVWFNVANRELVLGGTVAWTPVRMFEDNPSDPWYRRQRPTFWSEIAATPTTYAPKPLLQMLAHPFASILSKQWILHFVNPWLAANGQGLWTDWTGDFGNWTSYHWMPDSPLDLVGGGGPYSGVTCGTGPYILSYMNGTALSLVRNTAYWRGWPADWPNPPYPDAALRPSGVKPAGWVEKLTVRKVATGPGTGTCIGDLKNGDCDIAFVNDSSKKYFHMYNNTMFPTEDGVQCLILDSSRGFRFYKRSWVNGWFYTNSRTARNPRTFALVVGVERDDRAIENVTMIHNDAQAATSYLYSMGWNVTTLIDSNATVQSIGDWLDWIRRNTNQDDYVLFYFTGHGGQTPDVAPIDEVDGLDEFIVAWDGNILDDNFTEWVRPGSPFNGVCSKHLALIFDCCHSGGFIDVCDQHAYGDYQLSRRNDAIVISAAGGIAGDSNVAARDAEVSWRFYLEHRYSEFTYHFCVDNLYIGPCYQQLEPEWEYANRSMYNCDLNKGPTLQRPMMRDYYPGNYTLAVDNIISDVCDYSTWQYRSYVYAYTIWKWNYREGNVDFNGYVNMGDVTLCVDAFGGTYRDRRWNFWCDRSANGMFLDQRINMFDVVVALEGFGQYDSVWQPP